MKLGALTVAVLVALGAIGCGAEESAPRITRSPETTMLEPTQPNNSSPSPSGGEGGVPAGFVETVVGAAAELRGVDESEVSVVEASSIEWPDGSLGCPEPGMLYMQVITPGYRVVVSVGQSELDFRLNSRGGFRLCETGAVPDVRDPDASVPGSTLDS